MRTPASLGALGGRYLIEELLGRGGMGDVYAGIDSRLQRPIAVKLLRSDLAERAEVKRRFELEAKAAARLTHPNVVAVFDSGEADDGTPFIVMERLPGGTLADRLGAGPVENDWLFDVMTGVLAALEAAHRAGIIHRDVKPGNILLAADGVPKVADFGIAKSLDTADRSSPTDGVVGTPAYLAPERIDGSPATPLSDLYSAGVILYEGLAGEKPFRGDNAVVVATAVRDRRFVPLGQLRPDLAATVVPVVDRAMAADPSKRYPSANDMAAALGVARVASPDATTRLAVPAVIDQTQVLPAQPAAAAGHQPVSGAPASSPRRRLVTPADRRSALFGAAVAAILAIAAALVILNRLLGGPAASDPSSPPSSVPRVTVTTTAPLTVPPLEDEDKEDDDDDERGDGHSGKGKGGRGKD